MLDLLSYHPWLIVVSLALLIPIVATVFGTTTHYLARTRQAELEASLKQEMLQRGMSAEEIKMVIEATAHGRQKSCGHRSASLREMT
jgi:hypothetical protein